MITIYNKTYTEKEGGLSPLSCVITEELNGAYELVMKHPYDDTGKWKRIAAEKIILADTPKGKQPFRIYHVQPDMNSITVNARHIFYDLLDNFVEELDKTGTAAEVLSAMQSAMQYSTQFTFATDIAVGGTVNGKRKNPVELLLDSAEEALSFVNAFGAELVRDGYTVSMQSAMGEDRGYRISYGKNLVGLSVTEDSSSVVTRYYTIGADNVTGGYVDSARIGDYANPKIAVYENSELKTAEELRAAAQDLFDSGADLPTVNIAVDFVLLQNTEEYKDYAILEEVYLGDVVTVVNKKMGFAKKAKVISYEYDAMLKRYNKMELGDFLPTIYALITNGSTLTSGRLPVMPIIKGGTSATTEKAAVTNLIAGPQNPIGGVSDYLNLPFGITEGVYSGLKVNDPFSENGAKRIWALRSVGSSKDISVIFATCLDGGSDTGKTFVGYCGENATTVRWKVLSSTNSSGSNGTITSDDLPIVPIVKGGTGATTATDALKALGAAPAGHTHTAADIGAAQASHTHDDRYYTETEVDSKLSGKANADHTHTADDIGAASATHEHNYAGADSSGGVAYGALTMDSVEAISTDGVTYTATVPGITELYNGLKITIIPKMTSASTSITLNVNGLGAKKINHVSTYATGTAITPGDSAWLAFGNPVTLTFNGRFWAKEGRADARDIHGTVAIANGGTGATTTAKAIENLLSGETYILSGINNYADFPYGISEGVYAGLKTNDPFTETGAKRVWILRSHGSGLSLGCIFAFCLDGGNDTGKFFVGYASNSDTIVWTRVSTTVVG